MLSVECHELRWTHTDQLNFSDQTIFEKLSSFKSHCCYFYQFVLSNFFNLVHFFVSTRICISFDQINTINFDQIEYQIITINFDQIEYQIITISFDLIEYSKCEKNNSRKDRLSKHSHSRDHLHSRDYLHLLNHDQLLSKNVHHHQLKNQMSTIKNFSESCEMNQARSWSMNT
jgi:hypothetical protein